MAISTMTSQYDSNNNDDIHNHAALPGYIRTFISICLIPLRHALQRTCTDCKLVPLYNETKRSPMHRDTWI